MERHDPLCPIWHYQIHLAVAAPVMLANEAVAVACVHFIEEVETFAVRHGALTKAGIAVGTARQIEPISLQVLVQHLEALCLGESMRAAM